VLVVKRGNKKLNILDKFRDTSVGSSGRTVDYTPKIGSNGDFIKTYDLSAVIKSWNNILITPRGSCDHDPEFGSNLHLYLFEFTDEQTKEEIKDEIYNSLMTFDDRAGISDIVIDYLQNRKGFTVTITANYFGSKSNTSLTIDETTFQNYM
jgi:phage baseplate assembly protein W